MQRRRQAACRCRMGAAWRPGSPEALTTASRATAGRKESRSTGERGNGSQVAKSLIARKMANYCTTSEMHVVRPAFRPPATQGMDRRPGSGGSRRLNRSEDT